MFDVFLLSQWFSAGGSSSGLNDVCQGNPKGHAGRFSDVGQIMWGKTSLARNNVGKKKFSKD